MWELVKMLSSSTSNSNAAEAARWRKFIRMFIGCTVGLSAFIYGFVLIVDPYNTLPFSPNFEREPISTNARFSFPALAANARFDSAIIGTSTSRLLQPARLNRLFNATFANLAMNSATAYEQQRIFELFVHHHPQAKIVILGLDVVWCETEDAPPLFTSRPFPPWLYDYNPWNDALYLFNPTAVEQAGRQFARAVGLRAPKYGLDGYTNFLPPREAYDLEKARYNLYGEAKPHVRSPVVPPASGYADTVSAMRFPTHRRLDGMLASLHAETVKVLYFVPYHHFHQPEPGSLSDAHWAECKRRIAEMRGRYANMQVVDFMIRSKITLDDSNYWDSLHFDVLIAVLLEEKMREAVQTRRSDIEYFVYMGDSDVAPAKTDLSAEVNTP
jgi:hypothetical protein